MVWFGSIWFGQFPCLKKKAGRIPAEKNIKGKDLAWKRPNGEKTGGEKT